MIESRSVVARGEGEGMPAGGLQGALRGDGHVFYQGSAN